MIEEWIKLKSILHFISSRKISRCKSEGFATAEWVVLMSFTMILLATLVQGLLVENVRATTLASLRDAARAGTQQADLRGSVLNGSQSVPENYCESRLTQSLKDLSSAPTDDVNCEISQDSRGRYFMQASTGTSLSTINLIPWAGVFSSRLDGLSARYYPTENAR
jgi:hypothetical protein